MLIIVLNQALSEYTDLYHVAEIVNMKVGEKLLWEEEVWPRRGRVSFPDPTSLAAGNVVELGVGAADVSCNSLDHKSLWQPIMEIPSY